MVTDFGLACRVVSSPESTHTAPKIMRAKQRQGRDGRLGGQPKLNQIREAIPFHVGSLVEVIPCEEEQAFRGRAAMVD